jgi:hypothetical protein
MDLSEATPARGSDEDTRRSLPYRHRQAIRRGRTAQRRQNEAIPMSDSTSSAASTVEPHQVETATIDEGEGDTGAFAFTGGEHN